MSVGAARTRPGRLPRIAVWLLALSTILPLMACGASATSPPVVQGKVVAPGAFGIPYGQGPNPPPVPFVSPSTVVFADGGLVYDTQVSVEVFNANPFPLTLPVSVEEYDQGTAVHLVNLTEPNGTIVPTRESYSVRLHASWTNATLDVLPDSSAATSLAVAPTGSPRSLSVSVGSATWDLSVLTPASSSLAGIYSVGGVNAVAATGEGAGFFAAVLVFALAYGLTRRVYRTPKVSPLWPILWIFVPGGFYYGLYVPLNQVLGVASPYVFPFVLGVAGFPYVCRGFKRSSVRELQGVHALNSREKANTKGMVEFVDDKAPLRVAPRSWREVFLILLGLADLREVHGWERKVLGEMVRVDPQGEKVALPPGLGKYHQAEPAWSYWYDARYKVEDVPTRIVWRHKETAETPSADPTAPPVKSTRIVHTHVEPGHFSAVFVPTRPVLEHLAGLRNAEATATEGEVARLRLLSALGSVARRESESEYRGGRIFLDALSSLEEPRGEAELQSLVERMKGGKRDAPKETSGEGKSTGR